jgi:hypothetical protein
LALTAHQRIHPGKNIRQRIGHDEQVFGFVELERCRCSLRPEAFGKLLGTRT